VTAVQYAEQEPGTMPEDELVEPLVELLVEPLVEEVVEPLVELLVEPLVEVVEPPDDVLVPPEDVLAGGSLEQAAATRPTSKAVLLS
jgi:hypothetical protein